MNDETVSDATFWEHAYQKALQQGTEALKQVDDLQVTVERLTHERDTAQTSANIYQADAERLAARVGELEAIAADYSDMRRKMEQAVDEREELRSTLELAARNVDGAYEDVRTEAQAEAAGLRALLTDSLLFAWSETDKQTIKKAADVRQRIRDAIDDPKSVGALWFERWRTVLSRVVDAERERDEVQRQHTNFLDHVEVHNAAMEQKLARVQDLADRQSELVAELRSAGGRLLAERDKAEAQAAALRKVMQTVAGRYIVLVSSTKEDYYMCLECDAKADAADHVEHTSSCLFSVLAQDAGRELLDELARLRAEVERLQQLVSSYAFTSATPPLS